MSDETPTSPRDWDDELEAAWRKDRLDYERQQGTTLAAVPLLLLLFAALLRVVWQSGSDTLILAWSVVTIGGLGALWSYRRARTLARVRAIQLVLQLLVVATAFVQLGRMEYYGVGILVISLTIWGPNTAFIWPQRLAAVHFFMVPLVSALAHPFYTRPLSMLEVGPAHAYLLGAAAAATFAMGHRHEAARKGFAAIRRLEESKTDLEMTVRRLVQTQDQLVEQGKMAVLGQLVAGVAHELNTPLGAILASADNLEHVVGRTRTTLLEDLCDLSQEERVGLRRLLQHALRLDPMTSSREERAARRLLHQQLQESGVPEARRVAASLVEIGMITDIESHLPLLRSPRVEQVLDHARDLVDLGRNTRTIHGAASRAGKTVFALKSFAHPGAADSQPTTMSLAEHLNTVLTLYRNQLKRGITVVTDYQDPGEITARHAQLDQVWTNLIHNAIQAMDYDGRLIVRVISTERGAEVQIEDDGPGIPDEVQSRVFEPFFTTKPTGEGTGLGLSICRDIVTRAEGTLRFSSEPGRTVFRVSLPARPPDTGPPSEE